jgi:hypothetical protein
LLSQASVLVAGIVAVRRAAGQNDPQLKQDFLVMERRFLFLARSYGFTEQLTDFSNETKRQADRLATSRA